LDNALTELSFYGSFTKRTGRLPCVTDFAPLGQCKSDIILSNNPIFFIAADPIQSWKPLPSIIPKMNHLARILFVVLITQLFSDVIYSQDRHRVRDLGITPGILTPGPLNAITDVDGVMVGHLTRIEGDNIRTGVTAILPHDGNLFRDRVPAAVYVGNGFGKALGFTQVRELGELETPLALTNTLSIFDVAKGVADYVLNQSGNENVRSVNPVIGETNDGYLNNIRARVLTTKDFYSAIDVASSGPVAEGNVGAGTGTRALGFKAGIGTSSRRLPESRGGYTVGVLVQSNFGGVLTVNGAPVGEELGNHYMSGDVPYDVSSSLKSDESRQTAESGRSVSDDGYDYDVDGSIMIVVATDAPLTSRNLERLAKRAMLGVARTGGFASNGSGDYVIAFSTHDDVRRNIDTDNDIIERTELTNSAMSPLFLAAVEATEEAILNSLFMAKPMTGHDGSEMDALPIDKVMEILKEYNVFD
jgi:D-aminopeptidase